MSVIVQQMVCSTSLPFLAILQSSVELSETAASTPTTHAVQDRTPSLQQGQYNPTHAGTTMTATPTSVSPSAHGTTTVSQLPSRVSPSVVPSPRTNQYHSPGMTNVNSFEPDEPPPQPEPRASGRSVTSGGAPLPTPQQVSGVSRARPENYSSLPPDYPSLSDSAASQQSSSAPSEQPQLPQPPLAQATSLPVAPTVHAQSVTVGQDQQLPDDSPKSSKYCDCVKDFVRGFVDNVAEAHATLSSRFMEH